MTTEPPTPSLDNSEPPHRLGWLKRVAALAEVCLVFALAHLSFRAFKHFTPLGRWEGEAGLNYSTGGVLGLFALGAVVLGRRRFTDYGLTIRTWRRDLSVGLLTGLLLAIGAALLLKLTPIPPTAFQHPDLTSALIGGAGHLVVALVILRLLNRSSSSLYSGVKGWREGAGAISLALLLAVLILPVALALVLDRRPLVALAAVGWLFVCAGFGEEIFFRGYVQSRINQAFGRPLRILGVDCGVGLIVSSLLFGLIHVLNGVDYFADRFEYDWWFGVMNFFAGLFFGLLRDKTGSIVAGGVAHGLLDVLAQIPRLLAGES
jgi:membrane protease YdiL (CAAX protease family)